MKTNSLLCIDLKTKLQNEVLLKPGKDYLGVLRHDITRDGYSYDDSHYTFLEILPSSTSRRNPKVFNGEHITLTRWNDGSFRLYFKKLKIDTDFTVDGYALAVCNELRQALKGLVEK